MHNKNKMCILLYYYNFVITTSNEALYLKYIEIKKEDTNHDNKGNPLNAHIKKALILVWKHNQGHKTMRCSPE